MFWTAVGIVLIVTALIGVFAFGMSVGGFRP